MGKSDIVRALSRDFPEYRTKEIRRAVDLFFDAIIAHMSQGGRVELRGFGVFGTRAADSYIGRNPKNGVSVIVPSKNKPFFKAGKPMHIRLNP